MFHGLQLKKQEKQKIRELVVFSLLVDWQLSERMARPDIIFLKFFLLILFLRGITVER